MLLEVQKLVLMGRKRETISLRGVSGVGAKGSEVPLYVKARSDMAILKSLSRDGGGMTAALVPFEARARTMPVRIP